MNTNDAQETHASIRLPLRSALQGHHAYGAPQLQVTACLNVNENPFQPPQQVIDAMTDAIAVAAKTLNRYPERDCLQLRADLAQYISEESGTQVNQSSIWVANGSNEIMMHLFQAYAGHGRKALTCTPSYSMYPEYAQVTDTDFLTIPRDAEYRVDIEALHTALQTHRPSLVLLASPNNPTGTALPYEDIEKIAEYTTCSGPLIDGVPTATIVVIDEAYAEFRRTGTRCAVDLPSRYPHVVVTRTLSKAFGAAGLRLGYMVADPQIIHDVQLVRLPYHVSAITQATASAAITHRDELVRQVELIRRERDALYAWLLKQGLDVLPSDANFICFGQFADRHQIFEDILSQGVLIREVGPQGYVRVSIGTPEENDLFKQALLYALGKR